MIKLTCLFLIFFGNYRTKIIHLLWSQNIIFILYLPNVRSIPEVIQYKTLDWNIIYFYFFVGTYKYNMLFCTEQHWFCSRTNLYAGLINNFTIQIYEFNTYLQYKSFYMVLYISYCYNLRFIILYLQVLFILILSSFWTKYFILFQFIFRNISIYFTLY